jgi:hypothetical protein
MKVLGTILFLGLFASLLVSGQIVSGQNGHGHDAVAAAPDPWKALSFLEGTWEAKAQGEAGVAVSGSYTFQPQLDHHLLARHSKTGACKGPASRLQGSGQL